MSDHICAEHLLVVHAEGSDTHHILHGVRCLCLPKVSCAICDDRFFSLGEELGRSSFQTSPTTLHVYPAWQEKVESA